MNICFLSREYPPKITGGVGVYIYEMARALTMLGHKVYVITEAFDEEGEFNEDGIYVYRIKPVELPVFFLLKYGLAKTFERLEYSFAVSKKLKEIAGRNRIDVVESTDARTEGFWYYLFHNKPALLIKLHTPESIIFNWNNDQRSLDHSLIKMMEEFWILKAKKLLSISSEMPEILSRYYGLSFSRAIQHPNPIDSDLFKPEFMRKDPGAITILYVGRLEFRKGVHVLIRAVPEVLNEFPSAKFIFVGRDCGMKAYLEKKVAEFDCGQNVVFIDQVNRNELPDFYRNSTLCVVPSLWENFPYTCLEAMACGRPVAASNAGGISEIVKDGLNGILVTPGSVKELAGAAIRILKNRNLADALGNAASEFIKERYNRFKIVKESIRIYQGLSV